MPSTDSDEFGFRTRLEQVVIAVRSSLRAKVSRARVPRADFEDLEQETWRRLLPYLARDSAATPRLFALVHRISMSVVADYGRRRRAIMVDHSHLISPRAPIRDVDTSSDSIDLIDPAAEDPFVAAVHSEEARLVRELERLLTPRQRAVIELVFVAERRPATIAHELGISRITVWRELRDAQLALERLLRPLLHSE